MYRYDTNHCLHSTLEKLRFRRIKFVEKRQRFVDHFVVAVVGKILKIQQSINNPFKIYIYRTSSCMAPGWLSWYVCESGKEWFTRRDWRWLYYNYIPLFLRWGGLMEILSKDLESGSHEGAVYTSGYGICI